MCGSMCSPCSLRTITSDPAATGRRTPIIALTAHTLPGDRERCIEAGMDGFVTKPVRADELTTAIREAVATKL